MVDKDYVLPWIEKAEHDISSSLFLAKTMHPVPTEIVCFHCQQAAEKYLKAFLVFNDIEPPKTHNLIELVKMCAEYDDVFLQLLLQCEFLTPFGVETRYPDKKDPDKNDMNRALAYAEEIIGLVKSKMPKEYTTLTETGAPNV